MRKICVKNRLKDRIRTWGLAWRSSLPRPEIAAHRAMLHEAHRKGQRVATSRRGKNSDYRPIFECITELYTSRRWAHFWTVRHSTKKALSGLVEAHAACPSKKRIPGRTKASQSFEVKSHWVQNRVHPVIKSGAFTREWEALKIAKDWEEKSKFSKWVWTYTVWRWVLHWISNR